VSTTDRWAGGSPDQTEYMGCRYVIVTGGVSSSLGKGLVAASLGRLLACRGAKVALVKLDPYLNCDPGTMNPLEHGEVYVSDDGGESDLDLGTYERVAGVEVSKASSVTGGSIYASVISKERQGAYLGKTVQVVPHVTDEIITQIMNAGEGGADIVIAEVGGTVGDIEVLPFLEAVRQLRRVVGRNNVAYVHLALVPEVGPQAEMKTKPVQHSIAELRGRGIIPDAVVCRSKRAIDEHLKRKISLQADLPIEAVVSAPDVSSIYDVPLRLAEGGLDDIVAEVFGLAGRDEAKFREWAEVASRFRSDGPILRIGIVGKYGGLVDAYASVIEAIRHAGAAMGRRAEAVFVDAEALQEGGPAGVMECLAKRRLDGIVVAGGFGARALEGKIAAVGAARRMGLPTLGICFGMQAMAIEAARSSGLADATSSEVNPEAVHPVVSLLHGQEERLGTGGTMRLGAHPAVLAVGSRVAEIYGTTFVNERHRHRYEINPAYRDRIEAGGLSLTGLSPDGRLVEFLEDAGHPYFIGTQAHPEFKSRPERAHPLFMGLVAAAMRCADGDRASLAAA
jgi:CTP synthase